MKTGKTLRTLLAFLLVLTCVVGLFPMAAFADETVTDVTDELTEDELAELERKRLQSLTQEQNLIQEQNQSETQGQGTNQDLNVNGNLDVSQGQGQEQGTNQDLSLNNNLDENKDLSVNQDQKQTEPQSQDQNPNQDQNLNQEQNLTQEQNLNQEQPQVQNALSDSAQQNAALTAPAPAKAPASGTESTESTDKFTITVDAPKAEITTGGDIKKEADGKYSLPKDSKNGGSLKFMPKDEYTTLEKPVVEKSKDMEGSVEQVEGGGWLLKIKKLLANIKVTVKGDDWRDAYYWFNCQVVKKIKEAPKDGTVEIDGRGWASFMRMVPEALNERSDVTMKLTYIHRGRTETEITVPAGSDILGSMRVGKSDILFDEIAELVK